MSKRKIAAIIFVLTAVLLMAGCGQSLTQSDKNYLIESKAEKDLRTQWWREARFGMFVHFGLYSIPAGVWKGEVMGRNGYAEWIRMQQGFPGYNAEGGVGIERAEYDTLLDQFNPVNFDAEKWILEARNAGMKYFLITAKHHDGFALWPSKVSKYNVVDATPFKRDILGELSKACKKYDIKLGFYYSHWQDWGHPGGAMPPWSGRQYSGITEPTVKQPSQEAFEQYWQEICLPQVRELLENYHPSLLWFDTWCGSAYITEKRIDELITLVRKSDPACLINSRIGAALPNIEDKVDYVSMGDNQFPEEGLPQPWQTSGTMNDSWGYHQRDFNWKPTSFFLKALIQNSAHGGNYQLNVGPKGDGSFPKPSIKRLREMGAWLAINGEAIYGTSRSPVKDPDWGYITTRKLPNGNIRLYLHVLNPRPNQQILLMLNQPPATTVKARMLETDEEIHWTPVHQGMLIDLPRYVADSNISVIIIDLAEN